MIVLGAFDAMPGEHLLTALQLLDLPPDLVHLLMTWRAGSSGEGWSKRSQRANGLTGLSRRTFFLELLYSFDLGTGGFTVHQRLDAKALRVLCRRRSRFLHLETGLTGLGLVISVLEQGGVAISRTKSTVLLSVHGEDDQQVRRSAPNNRRQPVSFLYLVLQAVAMSLHFKINRRTWEFIYHTKQCAKSPCRNDCNDVRFGSKRSVNFGRLVPLDTTCLQQLLMLPMIIPSSHARHTKTCSARISGRILSLFSNRMTANAILGST